jgi:hypothetical protein
MPMISTLLARGRTSKSRAEEKIKYKIPAGNRTILDAGQTVAFDDKNFEVVNECVYLGVLLTPKNDVGLEIQPRI